MPGLVELVPFWASFQYVSQSVSSVQFSSVSQLFHGPAPRSPFHRLSIRLRRSRSNTSTEYSLPGATQLSQVRSISPSGLDQRTGCSLSLFALYC